MRRNREQRLGQFANILNEEVLDILTRQYNGGFLFADALHKVSDILDRSEISEEEVKFIDTRDGISAAQKLLGHIRKHIEQQSVSDIFARLEKSLYAKCDEIAVCNVRMTVEKLALRAFAYRVQSEADILQVFGGVEIFH